MLKMISTECRTHQ